jgi:hypothetical protein
MTWHRVLWIFVASITTIKKKGRVFFSGPAFQEKDHYHLFYPEFNMDMRSIGKQVISN